jgi:hypothetical protein
MKVTNSPLPPLEKGDSQKLYEDMQYIPLFFKEGLGEITKK